MKISPLIPIARQFSLRALLLLPVIVAIVFSGLGRQAFQHNRERAAAAVFEDHGGTVMWTTVLPRSWHQHCAERFGFTSIYQEIKSVVVNDVHVEADVISRFRSLRNVAKISLDGTTVTDEMLPSLAELSSLKRLSLEDTQISDAGLPALNRLRRLTHLHIARSNVTGDSFRALVNQLPAVEPSEAEGMRIYSELHGQYQQCPGDFLHSSDIRLPTGIILPKAVAHLQDMPQLRTLTLVEPRQLAVGLAKLANLPLLRTLHISCHPEERLSSQEWSALAQVRQLESLVIEPSPNSRFVGHPRDAHSGIDGKALRSWTEMERLRALRLPYNTVITDEDVDTLLEFTYLQVLDLRRCSMSIFSVERLVQLPHFQQLILSHRPQWQPMPIGELDVFVRACDPIRFHYYQDHAWHQLRSRVFPHHQIDGLQRLQIPAQLASQFGALVNKTTTQ